MNIIDILKYKELHNLTLNEVSKHFNISTRQLRKLAKQSNIDIPKRTRTLTDEHKTKIKLTNKKTKNSPELLYNWDTEYKLFIDTNKKDKTIGIKQFSKQRGYGCRYLRKYINDNNLYQPYGIVERTDEWKNNLSLSGVGVIKNPKGSNGKLKNKKLKKEHKQNITKGLVEKKYNNDYSEWLDNKTERELYYNEVHKITNSQPLHLLDNYEKRGNAGVDGVYHLDHIYPISKGFENGISPEIIGHINNLQMLPWKENILKSNTLKFG